MSSPPPPAPAPAAPTAPIKCEFCEDTVASKNLLFKHLVKSHGVSRKSNPPEKVCLLVGWMAPNEVPARADAWVKDGSLASKWNDEMDEVEKALWVAVDAVEPRQEQGQGQGQGHEAASSSSAAQRRKGFSRVHCCSARASYILGAEETCHGVCDTFCFQVQRDYSLTDAQWLQRVNARLPAAIRVLSVQYLHPAAHVFHPEVVCSQRVYEYMLPLNAFFTQQELDLINRTGDDIEATSSSKEAYFGASKWRIRNSLQLQRCQELKKIFKAYGSIAGAKKSWHNFATGGATPDESVVNRRVDRVFIKEVVNMDSRSRTSSAAGDGDAAAGSTPYASPQQWIVLSVSGDAMLRGQVRKMVGLAVAIVRKYLPAAYLDEALTASVAGGASSTAAVVDVPAAPGLGLYLSECRFDKFESKYSVKLDPRRRGKAEGAAEAGAGGGGGCGACVDAECLAIEQWVRAVQRHIAQGYEEQQLHYNSTNRTITSSSTGTGPATGLFEWWTDDLQRECDRLMQRRSVLQPLATRSQEQLQVALQKAVGTRSLEALEFSPMRSVTEVGVTGPASLPQPPVIPGSAGSSSIRAAYADVLRLLQEAERSGQWPASTAARQKIIQGETLVEQGGQGGSFSVGVLPPPLAQPRGNELFPELLKACFLLESKLLPHRPPSSTIAINRHAQFKPHRDNGAGNGQCMSLIVALGDFGGGEVVVEGTAHDIRYKPLEFDGWSDRHWTLPFEGQRYTLVWFTPLGVRVPEDLWWWKGDEGVEQPVV